MGVELQVAVGDARDVPGPKSVRGWVQATLRAAGRAPCGLTVRVTGLDEMTDLNHRFRGREGATNVLAFPFEAPPGVDSDHLGDVVVCLPVVRAESRERNEPPALHFARMVIHGTLHLCGHDHQTDEDAHAMEALERRVLGQLKIGGSG